MYRMKIKFIKEGYILGYIFHILSFTYNNFLSYAKSITKLMKTLIKLKEGSYICSYYVQHISLHGYFSKVIRLLCG